MIKLELAYGPLALLFKFSDVCVKKIINASSVYAAWIGFSCVVLHKRSRPGVVHVGVVVLRIENSWSRSVVQQ